MRPTDLEDRSYLGVPEEAGAQIKEIARLYPAAWRFITEDLGIVNKQSFLAVDDVQSVLCWREGRRFVGLSLLRILAMPLPDGAPPDPPARTMTERVRRRNKTATAQG